MKKNKCKICERIRYTHTYIVVVHTKCVLQMTIAGRTTPSQTGLAAPPSTTANIHKIRYRFIRSPPNSRCDKKKHSYWRWFFCCCIFACRFCDRVRLCVCCTQMCPSSHSRRRSAVCVCVGARGWAISTVVSTFHTPLAVTPCERARSLLQLQQQKHSPQSHAPAHGLLQPWIDLKQSDEHLRLNNHFALSPEHLFYYVSNRIIWIVEFALWIFSTVFFFLLFFIGTE